VTLTVGSAGIAVVNYDVAFSAPSCVAFVDFAMSGANTRTPAFVTGEQILSLGFDAPFVNTTFSKAVVLTGLTAGSTTFTLKYNSSTGGTVTFYSRNLNVVCF
jgi:hypothetical protein